MLSKSYFVLMAGLLGTVMSTAVYAKGEITGTQISTELLSATPKEYSADGKTYRWGMGEDLILKSVTYDGKELPVNAVMPDTVYVRRVSNSNSSGSPCSVFTAVNGDDYTYQSSYAELVDSENPGNCDFGKFISSNIINRGTLDVFANDSREYSLKNIERIDFVYKNGMKANGSVVSSGFVVIEKHANNHVQLAAIKGVDGDGNPNLYGPLVMVHPEKYQDPNVIRYGSIDVRKKWAFLTNNNEKPNGWPKLVAASEEHLGAAMVTLQDLGVGEDQMFYGVSIFAADVKAGEHNLIDPKTFPRDTPTSEPVLSADRDPAENAGDADLVVLIAGDFTKQNAPSDTGDSSGGEVAGDTQTKEVVDIVESPSVQSSGGGSVAIFLIFLSIMTYVRKPVSKLAC